MKHPHRDILGDGATRTLLAVITLESQDQRPSVRRIAAETELAVNTTHDHLKKLRRRGLIDWVDGKSNTMHSTCKIVRTFT